MQNRSKYTALVLSVLMAGACSPLRDSEAVLESRLLTETPLGTSKSGVKLKLRERGLANFREEFAPSAVPIKEPFRTSDWQSLIRVNLGSYGLFGSGLMSTDVIAYYVFRGDQLLEVAVVKETEGL